MTKSLAHNASVHLANIEDICAH